MIRVYVGRGLGRKSAKLRSAEKSRRTIHRFRYYHPKTGWAVFVPEAQQLDLFESARPLSPLTIALAREFVLG